MIRLLLVVGASCLVLAPLPGASQAGCRHVKVVQQQAVVAYQPVAQPYYWAVGQSLQDDARAERIASLVIQKLQTKQQLNYPASPESCPTPAHETLPLTVSPEVDRWSLTKKHCQACHETNENAKAALDMSDFAAISCDQKLDAIAACLDGAMPKGKPLPPDVLGNLLGEWAGAKTVQIP